MGVVGMHVKSSIAVGLRKSSYLVGWAYRSLICETLFNDSLRRDFSFWLKFETMNIVTIPILTRGKYEKKTTQVNRYGYPYFHRKRTVFSRNLGHSNTASYTRPHFQGIRPYTCRNLIMIGPYFCARYYGNNTVHKVTVNRRIRTASFDLGSFEQIER
jgi:hypothetical protein